MNKVLVAYRPTTTGYELTDDFTGRDTRVVWLEEINEALYTRLEIGGEFYGRDEIDGNWFVSPMVQQALAAVR